MKIIDLLNKIANGEEVPKEIKYNACLFAFERQPQDYYCEEYGNLFEYLINKHRTGEFLNDEVEIIEEKKIPEKLPKWATTREDKEYTKQEDTILIVSQKVDEIIDYLDYLKSKGE